MGGAVKHSDQVQALPSGQTTAVSQDVPVPQPLHADYHPFKLKNCGECMLQIIHIC